MRDKHWNGSGVRNQTPYPPSKSEDGAPGRTPDEVDSVWMLTRIVNQDFGVDFVESPLWCFFSGTML